MDYVYCATRTIAAIQHILTRFVAVFRSKKEFFFFIKDKITWAYHRVEIVRKRSAWRGGRKRPGSIFL